MRDVAVGAVGGEAVVEWGLIRRLPGSIFVDLLEAGPAFGVVVLGRGEGATAEIALSLREGGGSLSVCGLHDPERSAGLVLLQAQLRVLPSGRALFVIQSGA